MTNSNHEQYDIEAPDLTPEELEERDKVVAQTVRIAKRLHARALKNADLIHASNTSSSDMSVDRTGIHLIRDDGHQNETNTYVKVSDELGLYNGIHKRIDAEDKTKNLRISDSVVAPNVGISSYPYSDEKEKIVRLTPGQTRHLAAGVLSNVRGELARREIQHDAKLAEKAKKRADNRFDEFIEK